MPSDLIPACPVRTGGGIAGRSRADDIAMFGKEYRKQGVFGGTSFDSPAGKKGEDCAYEKQVLLAVTALIFAIAAWKKSASERERSFGRGKAIPFDRNGRCGKGCVVTCIAGSDASECGKCAGDNGGGCKQGGFRRGPDKYAGANTREDEKTKQKQNKKNKKKSGEERQNKVEQSIVAPSKPHKQKSDLFDFW